jgi:fluoride ion exporter CrcB/FEX
MRRVFLIGSGGSPGSVGRDLVSGFVQAVVPESLFQLGALAVTVLDSAGIGFLWELADR